MNKQITSFAANTSNCLLCKTEKHSLFACPQFKTLTHDRKMSAVRFNDLCINCLRPGHYVKQCRSGHRCQKCQKSHHSLLHVDRDARYPTPSVPTPLVPGMNLAANASPGTTSVAGLEHDSHAQSLTNLVVSPLQKSNKEINVSAVIVSRVTCDLPSQHIPLKTEWNHLTDLVLADPDFGRPGKIDLLLGVEVFSQVVLQGRL